MPKINSRRIIYQLRTKYLTLNNVVIAVAFLIAVNWVWGALGVMERNFALQKEVDYKHRQLELVQLQTDNLEFEKRYYQTAEYQELAVREALGLVRPGEKVLVLPPNSQAAKTADAGLAVTTVATASQPSNLEQWVNFLFGGYSRRVAGE